MDWRILTRAAILNYICVPAAAILLLNAFQASPLVAAGFIVLAVCPGAPYIPPLTAIARGDVNSSTGLMVMLAGSSAIISPLLLNALLPIITGDPNLYVDRTAVVTTLLYRNCCL